jgi:hypothetical protein
MDLDITNYDYEDILKLFNISKQFNEEDLKNAKKKVLASHPDKSGLDKSYFLFFSSAYKILFNIYNFREKHSSLKNLNNYNENYDAHKDEVNEELIHKIMTTKSTQEFNKWFNEQFDTMKITNDYEKNGYGDWLNESNSEEIVKCNDINSIHKIMEEKKRYNEEFIELMEKLNNIMVKQGEPFRAKAYQKAQETMMTYSPSVS